MPSDNETIFTHIYRRNTWYDGESVSGKGSSLEQTAAIREALPGMFRELGVRSLLDIPCGDFNWMRHVDLSGIDYTGADVVPELVEENRRRFPGMRFRCLDVVAEPLPRVDLILCRDCLVHLSLADCVRAIANIRASGSTYLLATTFHARTVNLDCRTGQWRPLNLSLPPFDLGEPLRLIDERCPEIDYTDKALGLWRIN